MCGIYLRELKMANFSPAYEKGATSSLVSAGTVARMFRIVYTINNKCISLTSHNFPLSLFFFLLFSVFPPLYISLPFRVFNREIAWKAKLFPLVLYFGSSLWFDNMENLEDTFRLLSRFTRGRRYVINNIRGGRARAFCIYTCGKHYNRYVNRSLIFPLIILEYFCQVRTCQLLKWSL